LIGDRDDAVVAHRAIPQALQLSAERLGIELDVCWLATEGIEAAESLGAFDGLWCVPASPYRCAGGALSAIRFARERNVPFLGTCGGFQHAVLEYARHVLAWESAGHAEICSASEGTRGPWVIAPLACALVDVLGEVRFAADSRLAAAYGIDRATEGYRCRYGVNPEFTKELFAGQLRAVAWDEAGEVRGVELADHPFFVATLFQPERVALTGLAPKLSVAFLQAATDHARRRQLTAEAAVVATAAGSYWLSARRELIDRNVVHAFLSRAYWSEGVPREVVSRGMDHSLCFGAYDRLGRQVGFARVISDRATFAYLADVFVLEPERGRGLSHRLIEFVLAQPELQGLRRLMLATRDAQDLYRRHGFAPLATPDRFMEINRPEIYRTAESRADRV
jgi:N-acetylglutamate synthase-like GNAT family acetyltransferase